MCKEGINKDETDACIDIDKEDIWQLWHIHPNTQKINLLTRKY